MTRKELLKIAKPILFNTEMVKVILEGRKTVTRRLVKPQPPNDIQCALGYCTDGDKSEIGKFAFGSHEGGGRMVFYKTPCKIGDILYIRETWKQAPNGYFYYEDWKKDDIADVTKWRPSIHMPKEAARIFLKVKDVRVERLQDITEDQAKAEGICRLYDDMSKEEYETWARRVGKRESQEECLFKNYLWHGNFGSCGSGNKLSDAWEYQYSGYDSAVSSFSSLWNTTVDLKKWDAYGWNANPWVWIIEFERIEPKGE